MRIIKKGSPKKELFWGDCRNCNSEIEAERGELKKIDYDPREQGELAKIKCPVCKSSMWLYPKQ